MIVKLIVNKNYNPVYRANGMLQSIILALKHFFQAWKKQQQRTVNVLFSLHFQGNKCTPTSRSRVREHIYYEDCVSVREARFKFCTNCKKNRCCYPRLEKTRSLEFQCGDGRRLQFDVQWIKRCRCDRKCYKVDARKPRRHRKRKQRRNTWFS